jgi:2,3-dihydroxybenzoate decarboxylase
VYDQHLEDHKRKIQTKTMAAPFRGTIAIEEAVLDPPGISWHGKTNAFYTPGAKLPDMKEHALTKALMDIHGDRLTRMDATGVEYMLLSLTSVGPQGEPDPAKAASLASAANDWLAEQVAVNPSRFGGLASLAMHDAETASTELRRAVTELGMFGAILNDFQTVYVDGPSGEKVAGKAYYDEAKYHPFWKTVEELGVPVYLHPRYPNDADLEPGEKYGPGRRHLLGAAVSFHLDLSYHIYALCSSGVFDLFPKVQIVIGHLGEG